MCARRLRQNISLAGKSFLSVGCALADLGQGFGKKRKENKVFFLLQRRHASFAIALSLASGDTLKVTVCQFFCTAKKKLTSPGADV
jgi:hypothetical protein